MSLDIEIKSAVQAHFIVIKKSCQFCGQLFFDCVISFQDRFFSGLLSPF